MKGLLNINHAIYEGVGEFEIPEIAPVTEFTAKEFGRLIYWKQEKNPKDICLHSFSYDYQFNTVWTRPYDWLPRLRRFDSVCSPDFSMYRDMPKVLQLYNKYRSHWVAKFWQENGIKVIPNIGWSTPDHFDWQFDGYPKNSLVCVSSVGCLRDKVAKELFLGGFYEMEKRLSPSQVIIYGAIPDELKDRNFIKIKHHYDAMRDKENAVE